MKIKSLFTILFLFAFIIANAQELPSPRISIQSGVAIPLSELAATDPDNISSGFAETGFGVAFEGIILLINILLQD